MPDPYTYQRLMQAFDAVCDHPADGRRELLDELCRGDEELRASVERMLAEDERSKVFLDDTPAGEAAQMLAREIVQTHVGLDPSELSGETRAPIPGRIGPYRVTDRLGAGGMGVVYDAEQEDPQRRIALKTLHPWMTSPEAVERLRFEAHALGQLLHPGIPQIYRVGESDGVVWLAMERVDGESLTDCAGRRELSRRQRIELLIRLCEAVHHAHLRGFVHRDLKPANILVTASGQPKVLDFGVAQALAPDGGRLHRLEVAGTLPYMSPEQMAGAEGLDIRVDVYALGVVGYELLAGRLPWDLTGMGVTDAVEHVLQHDPETAASVEPTLRGDLHSILHRALARDREDRYGSAAELGDDLRRHLEDLPVIARPSTWTYRAAKLVRRHRTAAVAAVAIVATLVGGLWAQQREAARANREAAAALEVSNFLTELFGEANPDRAVAQDVSARQLLDRGVERIEQELVDLPLTQARLMATMGVAYDQLGLYPAAERLLLAALERRRELLPPDHPDVASSLLHLGDLRRHQGLAEEAIQHGEEALELRRRRFPESSLEVAEAQNNLALALMDGGEYQRAERLFRSALETRQAHPDAARRATETLHNLALLSYLDGDYGAARDRGRQALASKRQILPEGHISTARTLGVTAQALQALGELEEAEKLFDEALAIQEQILGPEHTEVATTCNNLANVLHDRGDLEAAETFYRRALELWRRHFGDEHREVAISFNNLAWLHRDRGDLDAAEPLFRRSLEIRLNLWGEEHPDVARARHNLAALLHVKGQTAEAELLYRDALELRRRILRKGHPDTGVSAYQLAQLLLSQGDAAAASQLAEEAMRTFQSASTPHLVRIAESQQLLGASLLALGRHGEAERLLTESLATLTEQVGAADSRTRKAQQRVDELYRQSVQ